MPYAPHSAQEPFLYPEFVSADEIQAIRQAKLETLTPEPDDEKGSTKDKKAKKMGPEQDLPREWQKG